MAKEKNNKQTRKKIIAIIGAIVLLEIILFVVIKFNSERTNENSSLQEDISWLHDNCDCIERNNWKCPDGFYLVSGEKSCKRMDNKSITNVLLGCSKYDCNGTIHEVNY